MKSIPRAGGTLCLVMGACVMYYIWVLGVAPGDFLGDANDYFYRAAQMRTGTFHLASYSYYRGLFYPWFLSLTWGHDGFFTYLIQGALFLASLALALRVLVFNSIYGLLPVCAAMIPALAFLQKMVYPDGLLVSLTLLFFVALARKHWGICLVLGLILGLTKLIFLVVLPVALAVFLLQGRVITGTLLKWCVIAGLVLAPVSALVFSYVFVDLAYMVIYDRPLIAHQYALDRVFPYSKLTISCGGVERDVARKDFFLEPLTAQYQLAAYGPLSQRQAVEFGCTDRDLRSMKRRLLVSGFASDPSLHLYLAAKHFVRSTVGSYYVDHVRYVLRIRQASWRAHYDPLSYFEPREMALRDEFKKEGFEIGEASPSFVFKINDDSFGMLEPALRCIALAILGWCGAVGYKAGRLRECAQDSANIAMILFLIVYSFLLTLSAPLLNDRYTFVNLLVFYLLVSRLAAMTLIRQEAVP